jgi:DNA-binding protein YbaB
VVGEFGAAQQMPAWLDRLNALQAEAQQLAARFAQAATESRQFSARDATGTVEVTVTARGRVEAIRLRSDWRRQLDGDGGLANAVMEANSNAQRERVSAFATGATADVSPARPGPDAAPRPIPFEPADGPAGAEAQGAMRETLALIEAAQGQLDEAVQAARDRARREYAGHDAGRHVTVRVTGSGDLRQIEADEAFLRRMQPDYVQRACETAFADAYRNADAPPAQAAADDAVRELKALTDDPSALLRRLFGYR